MKQEISVKEIKWMLDFKTLEEIHNKGKALVSVYNLKRMANETIEQSNETIENVDNGTYTGIPEETLQSIKSGATHFKEKAYEVLEELNTYSDDALVEFIGGCQ